MPSLAVAADSVLSARSHCSCANLRCSIAARSLSIATFHSSLRVSRGRAAILPGRGVAGSQRFSRMLFFGRCAIFLSSLSDYDRRRTSGPPVGLGLHRRLKAPGSTEERCSFYAGARALLASHWPVDTDASPPPPSTYWRTSQASVAPKHCAVQCSPITRPLRSAQRISPHLSTFVVAGENGTPHPGSSKHGPFQR